MKMPKFVKIGLILLIGLSSFAQVKSQDDEADGFSDSYEQFSTQHDMYGDVDIDHRIGGVSNQEEKPVAAKSDVSDQKPAESLLSMSVDPLSDGMTGDPDIKKVLADVEAQEEINTSATSHRVPHQLNLAVGSSSAYNAPIQQLQYTQQPIQAPPPPPQSTLSEEHRQAIQQLALQQQHALAQLASEQRDVEQKRLEQEAVQVQYHQQQQLVQQFQQPTLTAQVQQQIYTPSAAPQLVQQVQPQHTLSQFTQPSPAGPQLKQYQQQPSDSPPQQLIQQYPSPSATPQLLTQAVGFGQQQAGQQILQQPVHQVFQNPTQATPIQSQQHVYQLPSQVPLLQQQQQIFQAPGSSQAPPVHVQQQQQVFEGPGPSQASPVHVQQPQQFFQSPSPSPPQVLHQQVYQGQQQQPPLPVPVPQPQLHVVQSPSLSPLAVQHPQQIYATGPSQQPPVQQVQQIYQQQQPTQQPQQPVVQQYQQSPVQYQLPVAGPTPTAPSQVQPQQFIYQSPSPTPQQQQPQPQEQLQFQVNAQHQQQLFATQFPQPQQQQVQVQHLQQPFQPGTPLAIEQYHRQVSPPPGQSVQAQPQQHQSQQDSTLALGSEQSSAISTSSPQQDQPKTQPPQNIQQILLQQNQPEISDESDYQQEQQPQQSPPETSTRYPQTYDIQAEYERAINSSQSQSPFSQQDLVDASHELNQYAQSIEERAAQILENFRRQVLGVNKKKETPTQDPPTTTTAQQEVQSNPTAEEQLNEAIQQALLPPPPFPTPEQQQQQQETQEQIPQLQGQEQNQQQQQLNQQAQQAQSDRAQNLENEIIQEGSASIQNQIIHSQNSLEYPRNQFGGGIQQQIPQQQQIQSQPQQQQGPPGIGNSPASPMQQTQAVIQQVIETQAIQQNSLQQLWQLYQQQAFQQQHLIQQQELQRQAAQVPVIAPQSPYQLLPQVTPVAAPAPVAPAIPKRRVPAPSYPQQLVPGPVLLPSQQDGPVYYQQFIGPVPTELRKPPVPQPESGPFTSVHDNSHYTIYKVKDDHDYRALSGLVPADQQIKIETSQPIAPIARPVPQYNAQQLPYNPYQLQPQKQILTEPAPAQAPAGQELVPLEEVGRNEEAHAFLQLPAHTHDQAPGPGPTQAPHTTLPVPQPQVQQQPYYPLSAFSQQQSQVPQAQNANSGVSDFYQVKSHSYVMPPQQTYNYPQGQAPSFVQQPSHQIQIQPQQFESVPAFSEENPSYQHHYAGTTYHHHSYPPQLGSAPGQQPVKHSKKHHHQNINYPKPVVTSLSKPSKRLRNKGSSQYSMIANMEYRPDIMLPADEASFAAHQAKVLGGPAFRDEGYNEQARAHPAVGLPRLNVNVNPTAAAESFGLALKPLLRLGKISANAFKEGFNQKMHTMHQAAHRRNTNSNNNVNTQVNAQEKSDELERQQIAAEASALSPTIAIALPTSRRKHHRNSNKMTTLIGHLEQAFSPRAGDLEGNESNAAAAAVAEPIAATAATTRAHKKSRKSAAYRERQAVLADLLKATAEADGVEFVPSVPAPAS